LRDDIACAIARLQGIRAGMKTSGLLAVGTADAADELRRIGGALVSAGTELHQAQRVAAASVPRLL
jgi:hypothetical protein